MTTFCTVITRNFAAHARVLARSVTDHHTDARVVVLIVDADEAPAAAEPFDVLTPSDVGIDRATLHEMAAMYGAHELCVALAPQLLIHLVERSDGPVVYLDADVFVLSRLEHVDELAREHGLVLTIHHLTPVPWREPRRILAGIWQGDDHHLLVGGQFNSGFLAVTRDATPFLNWWNSWLRYHCVRRPDDALFFDQKWLDCVMSFFPYAAIRDPGFNVAAWNLHERALSKENGTYLCSGGPLRFFHFHHFDPTEPTILSHDGPIVATGVSKGLCVDYANRLFDAGYREARSIPYGFARTASGMEVDDRIRDLYRGAVATGAPRPPDPFDATGAGGFVRWLRASSPASHGTSRYIAHVYDSRPDVRAHFPDLTRRRDRRRFLRWIQRRGIAEERIPRELTPSRFGGG